MIINGKEIEVIPGCDLSGMDLRGLDFSGMDLWNVNFSNSDLTGANLSGATIRWANLSGADLEEIKGKFIFTFQIGKAFSYYCDGLIKIGCKLLCVEGWCEQYKDIGEENDYSDEEIENYGKMIVFIKENFTEKKNDN